VGESPRGDAGAGSVLAITVLAITAAVLAVVLPVAAALPQRQRVVTTADSAALAAADVALGRTTGAPCEAAEAVARANAVALERCRQDGLVVTVAVSARVLGIAVGARATAGPPPS
jgi:secretion/DNA translocation related TadE-like protein